MSGCIEVVLRRRMGVYMVGKDLAEHAKEVLSG